MTVSQSNGNFINPANITGNYYLTNYTQNVWYSEKTIENSPLNRVMAQAAPGDVWAKGGGHEIEFEYKTNTLVDQVWIYWVDNGGNIQKGSYPGTGDYYPPNSLYRTATKDENGHGIFEFKDKQGKVILKRSFVTEYPLSGRNDPTPPTGTHKKADTYYVYDIYGNLAAVIPPLASEKTSLNTIILDNLCYIYKYDERNRLVEKKLPGKGTEYMVYDKQDRLVATQDANLRTDNKWLFTKYDKFGRVVYTGIFTSSNSQATLQASVGTYGSNNEERKTTVQFTQNGLQVYYTKQAFPNTFTDVLTVNYYDKYVNLSVYGFQEPESAYDPNPRKEANGKLKGMPTETHIRILGTSQWEKSVTFYDQKSRPIRSYKLNHLSGYTDTDSDLNFRGLPLETTTKHLRNANAIEVKVKDVFAYDHQERLLTHNQKINNGTNNLIAANTYDKLGRLITKKVGGTQNGSDRWQEVDYKYNIRGWLTDINNVGLVLYGKDAEPPASGDDLFAFKINYNVLNDGGSQYADPLYNGNIAQTIWKSGDDNVKRGYVYNYDELNRLLEAQFYKSDGIPYTGAYTENLAYDLNGNITSLFRTTGDVYGESVGMDDLAYSYQDGNGNSNRLLNVSDAVSTGNTMGFVDGNTNPALDDYEYDLNGNMVKDRNKGITFITYNHLNLPERIEWSANKFITYQYNAAGQKVTKTVRNNDSIKVVRYLDGFQYAGDILQFFPHPEGYVKATPIGNTPGAPPTDYAYNYVFNYTDHLGNIRLSYTKDTREGTLQILEENHYYPFGLKHEVYAAASKRQYGYEKKSGDGDIIELIQVKRTDYQYKYNGKEWQDELGLNFYDYGARNYDPALGRWMNIDPLAEQSRRFSPYTYALNNPVYFIDPDGMKSQTWIVNSKSGDSTYINDNSDDIVIVNGDDYAATIDAGERAIGECSGDCDRSDYEEYQSYLDAGDRYSPNEYGMYQFPESGRGFERYTNADGSNNGNNENYTVDGVRHKSDNWASAETFLSFYKTIQDFHTETGVTIHYGDISAYDPSVNLGHSTHFTGNSIDIHYMGSGGSELRGTSAYSRADVGLTNKFFGKAESNGFKKNYSYGNRFKHKGNANQRLHKDHFHIGR